MDRLFRFATLSKPEPEHDEFRREVSKLFAVAFVEAKLRLRPRRQPAKSSGKSKALTPRTR